MSDQNAVTTVCRAIVDPAMQEKFRAVLPPDVPLDRFTRVTIAAIQNNPSILECERQTLYNACVHAAQRGLLPDGREGALVTFSTKDSSGQWTKRAQFIAMVGGIIKEMANAGFKAHAVSVYANDEIEIWNDDDGQHLRHRPQVFGDRGERIGAVAWGRDKDGRTYVEALNREDIERIRARSKQRDRDGNPTGPWRDAPDRMEQKTALHRLRNRVAITTEFDRDEFDGVNDEPLETASSEPPTVEPELPKEATTKRRPRGLQAVVEQVRETPAAEAATDESELF